ncbi:oligosaccharide flippase family protein [Halovivax cerinus]|uniref:Oligosaccharide flippase family protein n=1 Tax=Halovivax cerinus TaxID=1487865 RepID=A0ABD5NIV1_9EURY|nr:oligosaccharide flippase family protein [Halovivax cerinus]
MNKSLTQRIFFSWSADIITTIAGFLGTIYLARTLGPAPLGVFALVISVIKWLLICDIGITQAAIKRISEGENDGEVITATFVLQTTITVFAIGMLFLFRGTVNSYIGGPYVVYIAVLFGMNYLASGTVSQILRGYQRVDISNGLYALERTMRVAFQVGLVFVGFRITGLMIGMITSLALMTIVGAIYLLSRTDLNPTIPRKQNFVDIVSFAKYSVLGVMKSQAFTWMDIAIMGVFVSNSVIGIYNVSWTLAMTFVLLANSIQKNLFPEVSSLIISDETDRVRELLSESMLYAGLLPIPGIVGALLLGDSVLTIYGPKFTEGQFILVLLVIVALLRAYDGQVHAVIDGFDRPDLTFRINIIFLITNIVLNVILIPTYGSLGAAMATVLSTCLSVLVSWQMASSLVSSSFPIYGVAKQITAAIIMGAVVILFEVIFPSTNVINTLLLIGLGALVYFSILFILLDEIRSKTLEIATNI